MDGALNFDGQKYISAKVAAQNFGYTSDYVGQLCRSKKVTSRLVGRSWYVLESDLVKHKETSHHQIVEANKNDSKEKLPKRKKIKTDSKKVVEKDLKNEILNTQISAEIDKGKQASYKPKENIANLPNTSRVAEIVEKKATYLTEENDLFPKPIKKFEPKFISPEELKISLGILSGVEKPTRFEKAATRVLVFSLGVTFLLASAFEGGNLARLAHQNWWHNLKDEVRLVYGPYLQNADLDLPNQIQSNIAGGNNLNQLAAVLTGDSLRPALDWFKNTAYKIAKPWLNNNFAQNGGGDLLPPDSPKVVAQVAVSEAPKTVVQSRTIMMPGSDRDYIDLRIDQKLTEFKKYFLTNPLAPNVNRYYLSRQNDVITSRISGSTSSSGSGSSGVATFLELTDTQSSFTANRIVHTNGAGTALTDTAGFVFDGSNLGIGTTTPYAPLSVVGQIVGAYFTGTTTATSTFGGNLAINGTGTTTSNGGINLSAGCYAINGNCISGGGSGASSTLLADSNTFSGTNNFTGKLAVGTSTPYYSLTVASTTGAQLALSAGAGIAQWTFRNAGGNLYLATTTVAGTSTTTTSALSILGSSGYVGIGSTTPGQNLTVAGTAYTGGQTIIADAYRFYTGATDGSALYTDFRTNPVSGNGIISAKTASLFFNYDHGNAGTFWSNGAGQSYAYMSQTGQLTLNNNSVLGATTIPSVRNTLDAAGGVVIGASYANVNTAPTNGLLVQGNVGIATTSPFARLSVESQAGEAAFVVGSSTATSLIVDRLGNVGVGIVNPTQKLDLGNNTYLTNGTLNLSAGQGSIYTKYLIDGNSNVVLTIGNGNPGNGAAGVSTTTPYYNLTVASTTGAQLALSAGTGIAQWVQRNAGGNFYLSTTTVAGTATTSISALEISGSGFGTTTVRGLNISGQATSTSNVGINLSAGCYAINGNCISGGGSGASSTLLADSNTWSNTNRFSGTVNLASVALNSIIATDGSGNVVATSTPTFGYFNATSTNATSTIAGGLAIETSGLVYDLSTNNVGINTAAPVEKLQILSGNILLSNQYRLRGLTTGGANAGIIGIDGSDYTEIFSPLSGVKVKSANSVDLLTVLNGGNVGVGTSTPVYRLTVASSTALTDGAGIAQWVQRNAGGNFYLSTTTVAGTATTSISALEISGSGFGTTTVRGLNISGQATTTSNVGINLSGGCFAINGNCVSGGGSGASSTLLADSNTFSGTNNFTQKLGLATTSPFARLSVESQAGEAAFVVGSSTATSLIVDRLGNVGVGTSTPYQLLSVYSTNTWPTIHIGGGTSATGVALNMRNSSGQQFNLGVGGSGSGNIANSLFIWDNNASAFRFAMNASGDTIIGSGLAESGTRLKVYNSADAAYLNVHGTGDANNFSGLLLSSDETTDKQWLLIHRKTAAELNNFSLQEFNGSTYSDRMTIKPGGLVGFGTTTPQQYRLTIASSTAPQLSLSAGTGIAQWVQRNAGGNLYFATTTVAGTSTTTTSALTILGSSGFIGIGTTSPFARLSVEPQAGEAAFVVGSSTATSLIVNSLGNVGVGTSNPQAQIHILGTNSYLKVDRASSASGQVGIQFATGGTTKFYNYIEIGQTNLNWWAGGVTRMSMSEGGLMSIGQAALPDGDVLLKLVGSSSIHPFSIASTSGDTLFRVTDLGNVGIGTTTPKYTLTVASTTAPQLSLSAGTGIAQWVQRNAGGNFYLSTTTVAGTATTSISALEISGSGFGTTTVRGLNISGQATSTSNVGINLSAGCYAINGNCISGGGSGASSTLLADSNTFSGTNNFTQKLGLATTSPFARLSVESQAGEAAFVVGSSTATSLIVDRLGNVGIGTTTPPALFTIGTNSATLATTKPVMLLGTSTLASPSSGGTYIAVNAPVDFTGDFINAQVNGTSQFKVLLSGSSGGALTVGGSILTPVLNHPSYGGTLGIQQDNGGGDVSFNNGQIYIEGSRSALGISTTTPYYNLTVASTTGAQLALSAGAGIAQWTQRNAGGNFYLSTTTVAGTSTTTVAAFSILGTSGNIGIATTAPTAKLSLQATISTDDLFRVSSTTGASLFKVNNYGALVQTLSSTTAISIQDSSGNAVFNVDTTQSTGAGLDITASGGQTANLFNIYAADGTTNYLAVGPSGNFGIGTGTPSHLFTVATSTTTKEPVFDIYYNSSGATSTVGFFVSTTTGSAAGVGLGLPSSLANYMIVGNGKVQAGMAIVNGGLCIDNDGWCTASTTGRISSVTSTTGGSDVAEMYNSSEVLEPGDVVAITEPRNFVKVANGAAGDIALGIVSTEPGVLLGLQPDANDTKGLVQDVETDGETISTTTIDAKTINKFPIALAGRVPVKVSIQNGEINPGDYLMLSSTTPGVVVKAVAAGQIVGQALEGYSDSAEGKILVFVKNTYYPGSAQVANVATSTFDQAADLSESEGLGATILKFFDELGIKVMNGIAYMKNLFVERLTVGTTEKPSGITLYDEDTGDPYCLKIKNGGMVSIAGECVGMVEVMSPITDNNNGQATTTATTTPTTTDGSGNNNSTTTATTTATSTVTNNSNDGDQTSTTTATTTATVTNSGNNAETVTNNDNGQTTTAINIGTVTDNSSSGISTTTTPNNP